MLQCCPITVGVPMTLLDPTCGKCYRWAKEAWLDQQKMHWLPEEVPMGDDVKDWAIKLTQKQKNLITNVFRFFTQADVEVGRCYMNQYSTVFKAPNVANMLLAFGNMESVHAVAYSHLIDTLKLPVEMYAEFLNYKEMKDKYDYLHKFDCSTPRNTALTLAVYGAFTEGLQLFSSFAILLNFTQFGLLKGMGQIVTWSIRDESLHTKSIIRLFHQYVKENPEIRDDLFEEELLECCRKMITLEDEFIDLMFFDGDSPEMKPEDVKTYMRFVANQRLTELKLPIIYDGYDTNPFKWIDQIVNGVESANFFESVSTEYTRASTKGDWADAFGDLK